MFCSNCGSQISEGGQFCPTCGQAVAQQVTPEVPVQQAEQQPEQPSVAGEMMKSFFQIVKGVFSKNIVKTVGDQAKNTGNEWIISIVLSILTFAFALPVNIIQGFKGMINGIAGGMIGSGIMGYIKLPFFSFFGVSLVIGIVVLATVVLGLRVMTTIVAKKNVSWICVLNLVGTATIPLSACYLVNMILGLIWIPLPILVSVVALLMTVVLLYVGAQKLEKPAVSPFYPYTIVITIVVIVSVLVSSLLLKAVFTNWIGSTLGSSLDMLDSLGSLDSFF